jgi:hypothetical protein
VIIPPPPRATISEEFGFKLLNENDSSLSLSENVLTVNPKELKKVFRLSSIKESP